MHAQSFPSIVNNPLCDILGESNESNAGSLGIFNASANLSATCGVNVTKIGGLSGCSWLIALKTRSLEFISLPTINHLYKIFDSVMFPGTSPITLPVKADVCNKPQTKAHIRQIHTRPIQAKRSSGSIIVGRYGLLSISVKVCKLKRTNPNLCFRQ